MKDLVSVIITTYNSSNTIDRTIMSVINQTYKNIELLIYDDSSKDDTVIILNKLLEPLDVKYSINSANENFGGPARGRNWGCSIANGSYICFLDADDFWKETKIEEQLGYFRKHRLDVVSTNATTTNNAGFKYLSGDVSVYSMIKRNRLILSSVMIKRELLKSLKYIFNEDKNFISVEDYELFLRCAVLNFKIYVIPKELIYYTVLKDSLSHQDFKENERKRLVILRKLKVANLFQYIWKWVVILMYKIK